MNQNNNQVQQSSQVSQEELAKTQVLNLNDVQAIAKFERKTSKRPAVLFAIAGILSISLGFAYPNIMTALDAAPSKIKTDRKTQILEEETIILNKVQENTMSCTLTAPSNPDGTSGVVTYDFTFNENNQLQSYTMVLELNPQTGNAYGLTTVQNYYNYYKTIDMIAINGYTLTPSYTDTGMKAVVTADLTTLNKAELTPTHVGSEFSNVPFNLGDTKEIIKQQRTASGYVCK